MPVADKKILIAGATGLAGTSILRHILDNCPRTSIRASYHSTNPFIKSEQIDYVQGDLTSLEDAKRMARGCEYAIMAAAFTGGAALVTSDPWRHIQENLYMNLKMLEAFHMEGIRRLIYVGSATLYQDHHGFIKEDQLDLNKEPSNPYMGFGWVGRFTEKMCRFFHEEYGMEIVIMRSSNIFGPYAKFNPATSNFIPAIIRKAADGMDPFEVWGSPEVVRDVIFSEDFARAVLVALEADAIKYDVFNLGSGVMTTVGDVVGWAMKHSGHCPSDIEYESNGPVTMKFRALDCAKIKYRLGWEPNCGVEEGIRMTTDWWKENRKWWRK